MASLNKVLIIGNLGRDPETRFATEGGLQITTINVATSRSYRSQASGQLVEETEWHRIVFFGKQAETIQKYLRKGSAVYVEGRLRTRKWEKDGVTHYATEIMGENFQFLDRRSDSGASSYPADSYSSEPAFNSQHRLKVLKNRFRRLRLINNPPTTARLNRHRLLRNLLRTQILSEEMTKTFRSNSKEKVSLAVFLGGFSFAYLFLSGSYRKNNHIGKDHSNTQTFRQTKF